MHDEKRGNATSGTSNGYREAPRSTLKELAESAGVSKATLHRLYGTRDNLVETLLAYGSDVLKQVLTDARLDSAPTLVALRSLIQLHLANRPIVVFLMSNYRPDQMVSGEEYERWKPYEQAIDAFFLKGQQNGVFRLDIPYSTLTELLLSLIFGMTDAEHRGRIASANNPMIIEQFFIHGAG